MLKTDFQFGSIHNYLVDLVGFVRLLYLVVLDDFVDLVHPDHLVEFVDLAGLFDLGVLVHFVD